MYTFKENQIPKIAIFQAHAQLLWWALIKFLRTSATRLNIQTKATKATTTTQTIFLMKWSLAKANSSVFHKYWSKKKNIFMWSKIDMISCFSKKNHVHSTFFHPTDDFDVITETDKRIYTDIQNTKDGGSNMGAFSNLSHSKRPVGYAL